MCSSTGKDRRDLLNACEVNQTEYAMNLKIVTDEATKAETEEDGNVNVTCCIMCKTLYIKHPRY